MDLFREVPSIPDPTEISFDHWERSEAVHRAIQELPTTQAEVVTLRIWEGMSFREIAEVTEESPHTIASRYRYAMEKLATLLQAHDEKTETVKPPRHRVCVQVENDIKK